MTLAPSQTLMMGQLLTESECRSRTYDQPHGPHDLEVVPHQRQEQGDDRRMLR